MGEHVQKGSVDLHATFGGFIDLHECFGGKRSQEYVP
jgi:hypothetical protein